MIKERKDKTDMKDKLQSDYDTLRGAYKEDIGYLKDSYLRLMNEHAALRETIKKDGGRKVIEIWGKMVKDIPSCNLF